MRRSLWPLSLLCVHVCYFSPKHESSSSFFNTSTILRACACASRTTARSLNSNERDAWMRFGFGAPRSTRSIPFQTRSHLLLLTLLFSLGSLSLCHHTTSVHTRCVFDPSFQPHSTQTFGRAAMSTNSESHTPPSQNQPVCVVVGAGTGESHTTSLHEDRKGESCEGLLPDADCSC
jgi:hypothetical protein